MRLLCAGIFFMTALCHAGHWGSIASDAARLTPAETHVFLEKICSGHETAAGCSVCPDDMPPSAQTWDVQAVTYGHFLSPKSDDALVSGFGCEPHVNLMSGSYLFTKQSSSWRKVWYSPGELAADCRKLPAADGRDLLACEGSDMHQGVADYFLYTIDPGRDPRKQENGPLDLFFAVDDSFGSCVNLPDGSMAAGRIESVSFAPQPALHAVRIVVAARLGKAVLPDGVMENWQATHKNGLAIVTLQKRYEFLFDGYKVEPRRGNPPTESSRAIAPTTSYRTAK